ncbi:MAG: thiamine-phosphate kinase [Cytophagaceae bacterium]|jgi:thiamine-monophosphate kinase|nr:thiamine-phosphate kinase [Cytophagaceae bacterium]
MEQQGMPLSKVGINGLIARIANNTALKHRASVLGFNDDASAVLDGSKYRLLTNVLFLEGIHFDLIYHPLKHLGYKAVVAAISDIIAMNGCAEQVSVSVGLGQRMTLESVDALMDGMLVACKRYSVDLVDFRPVPSFTGLSIAVAMQGTVNRKNKVSRNGGKPSDLLCVSGDLGSALMGLHLLEREKRVLKSNDLTEPDFGINNDYVLERQLKPEAKTDVVETLKAMNLLPSAMINVKNGLASALWDLCRASRTGCRVHENKIPLHQGTLKAAHEMNFNPLIAALNGGDDYELLFTLPLSEHERITDEFPENIRAIGYLTAPELSCRMMNCNGEEIEIREIGGEKS